MQGMMDDLKAEVLSCVRLLADLAYRRDPWLWDLDWSLASSNTKKRRILDQIGGLDRK